MTCYLRNINPNLNPDAELQSEQTIPYHVVPGVASPRAFDDTVTEKFGPH